METTETPMKTVYESIAAEVARLVSTLTLDQLLAYADGVEVLEDA